ncbi:MAG: hypothetical protein QM496_14190 [Verrucomicrobiota bacterium]
MTALSTDELDLLDRIKKKPELQPFFFRDAKGLKWFDHLMDGGYFDPKNNPAPIPTNEGKYVKISYWPVVTYLVNNSAELGIPENEKYAKQLLDLIRQVTESSKTNEMSNHRTWWQFSIILGQIPTNLLTIDYLDCIDHWLNDKYEKNLIAQEIGETWVRRLLKINSPHELSLALKLIELLFKLTFKERQFGNTSGLVARFRYSTHSAYKISKSISSYAGKTIGIKVVQVFIMHLKQCADKLNLEQHSSIWQPSIGKHEQNTHKDEPYNILVYASRDSLAGFIENFPNGAVSQVESLLNEKIQILERIAIHSICENFTLLNVLVNRLIDKRYFTGNYRHEMWRLLNLKYLEFGDEERGEILKIISEIEIDNDGERNETATAYHKAIWYSAIKDHGVNEKFKYKESVSIAGTEPEHPDFAVHFTASSWGDLEPPIPIEKLRRSSIDELLELLNQYEGPDSPALPGANDLAKALKQIIKESPLDYYTDLDKLANLNLPFISHVIYAFNELWSERAKLPWNDIWHHVLDFCLQVIKKDSFFYSATPVNSSYRLGANRSSIVCGIGRLLEAATKYDDNAIDESEHESIESILQYLLNNVEGREISDSEDAVSVSINTAKGQTIIALINLALRTCRIEDKKNNNEHVKAWNQFQHYFNIELKAGKSSPPEHEFSTLVTLYAANFSYMSKEWVMENLESIFDRNDESRWICAMRGYSYVGNPLPDIFSFLQSRGDFDKALDNGAVKNDILEHIIAKGAFAYLTGLSLLDDEKSFVRSLLDRNKEAELHHLITSISRFGREDDISIRDKVYALWPLILKNTNISTQAEKKLASRLCSLTKYIDRIDEKRKEWLLQIAPYANEEFFSYELFDNLARLSERQPREVCPIWLEMLKTISPDYSEENLRQLFTNLIKDGNDGIRDAKNIASEHVRLGDERANNILNDLLAV